jgi:hypothetical protein
MHFFVTRFGRRISRCREHWNNISHSNRRANQLRPRPWINAFDGREELEDLYLSESGSFEVLCAQFALCLMLKMPLEKSWISASTIASFAPFFRLLILEEFEVIIKMSDFNFQKKQNLGKSKLERRRINLA